MKLFFASLFGFVAVAAALPEPKATEFAPLDYFENNCARCHGSYGSFYGQEFGKNLTDEQLKTVVAEMAAGPAGAPLDDKNLEVLVAWHRALRDHKPFVAVTSAEKTPEGWKLRGEASPDATLMRDGKTVERSNHSWETLVGIGEPLEFTVRGAGESQTLLKAREHAYAPQ